MTLFRQGEKIGSRSLVIDGIVDSEPSASFYTGPSELILEPRFGYAIENEEVKKQATYYIREQKDVKISKSSWKLLNTFLAHAVQFHSGYTRLVRLLSTSQLNACRSTYSNFTPPILHLL